MDNYLCQQKILNRPQSLIFCSEHEYSVSKTSRALNHKPLSHNSLYAILSAMTELIRPGMILRLNIILIYVVTTMFKCNNQTGLR